jgi:acetyltransferase-like isoleucine patch superfamily enzyme
MPAQIAMSLLIYALYAVLIGASLTPAMSIGLWAHGRLLPPEGPGGAGRLLVFCFAIGACLFVFLSWTLVLFGAAIRILSLGVRAGTHRLDSPTVLFWMLLNGLHTIAFRALLPLVPSSFLTLMYFRLTGCRIGRNVWLTTAFLLDPYMMSVGDGTMVGGDAVISARLFEAGSLSLAPVRIGRDCTIGAHALISPGVTIGDGTTIGMRAYVREGERVPPGSRIASMAGLPARRLYELERGVLLRSIGKTRKKSAV